MNSTENTLENSDLKQLIPSKVKFLVWLADKGLVFAVMFTACWVMFNLIVEDRKYRDEQIKEQNKQIEDLRKMVDDCAQSKKDQLTKEVQAISLKVDRILIQQNI